MNYSLKINLRRDEDVKGDRATPPRHSILVVCFVIHSYFPPPGNCIWTLDNFECIYKFWTTLNASTNSNNQSGPRFPHDQKLDQKGRVEMQNAPALTNSEAASDVGIMRCTKGLAQGRSNLSSDGARPCWRPPLIQRRARLSERQTAQGDRGDLVGSWLEQSRIWNSFPSKATTRCSFKLFLIAHHDF